MKGTKAHRISAGMGPKKRRFVVFQLASDLLTPYSPNQRFETNVQYKSDSQVTRTKSLYLSFEERNALLTIVTYHCLLLRREIRIRNKLRDSVVV